MRKLNKEEENFLKYWEEQRNNKKYSFYFIIRGIKHSSYFIVAIILVLISGWYKRISYFSPSLMLMFLIGCIVLVVFSSIFTNYFIREQNEQRFQELRQFKE